MKTLLTTCLIVAFSLACKKGQSTDHYVNNNSTDSLVNIDSLIKIKDTVVFGNSAEGEEVILYKLKNSQDSLISITALGEMGKATYSFIYNNGLINGERILYQYEKPIYDDPEAKIVSEEKITLTSSNEDKKTLEDIYQEYYGIFNTYKNNIDKKWYGTYEMVLNDKDKDWQNDANIQLQITKDSVIYTGTGYQLYQKYLLKAQEKDNKLQLSYWTDLDNTAGEVLNTTKDFGTIQESKNNYNWNSPYLQKLFDLGADKTIVLSKENMK